MVIPIVTPEEMAAIDRDAPEPVEVLIGRAGAATARAAVRMLGGTYGKRVTVVAGKGNNGNDGRDAAVRLERRGVRTTVVSPDTDSLPPCDLVIDAAYGTGFRGEYKAPDAGGTSVLSVDTPSGVNGLTGEAGPGAVRATATVSFAALKPGLLLYPGRDLAGEVDVVDIGLDCSRAKAHLVERRDVAEWLPHRAAETHKWKSALWVVAGSPGLAGAAVLTLKGAQRTGAGYVRLSTPGAAPGADPRIPIEVVSTELPGAGWAADVLEGLDRFRALVVGPGIGLSDEVADQVRQLVANCPIPILVDADGLTALGQQPHLAANVVLTPHDGEYERLMGHKPGADRLDAARALAAATGAIVLLKGSTTVVAAPEGDVLVTTTGGAPLATLGTGDVLSGIIGSLLAQGLDPAKAAAAGAWLHGRAGHLGFPRGLVAGDVAENLPRVFDELEAR